MPFVIQESSHPGIWSVIYEGTISLEARLQAIEAGCGIFEARPATGILVDFRRAQLEVCDEHAYDLAKRRVSSSYFLGVKTALLFKKVPKEAEFDVIVSQNRGLSFRIFSDECEAVEWLRGPE